MSLFEHTLQVAVLDARQVKDVEEEPWVCTMLESFGCIIAHVPRSDLKDGGNLGGGGHCPEGEEEESRMVQRRVCGQIGRLTRLQTLYLGHVDIKGDSYNAYFNNHDDSYNSSGDDEDDTKSNDLKTYRKLFTDTHQDSCLALTLAHGLDLLAGLTRLRHLDVRGMNMGIWGVEE